ncbi:metallophosphoesterase, partial [Bacteroides heparinolyticus]
MKKIIELFFLCCVMANSITVLAQQPDLRFRSDKKFKIVQFTDIHWVPGNPASEDAYACMNAVLDAEKPDLVVYTGDLVYGKPAAEALQ